MVLSLQRPYHPVLKNKNLKYLNPYRYFAFCKVLCFSVHRHGTRNVGKKIVQRIDLLVGALQTKFMSEGVPNDDLKWILGMSVNLDSYSDLVF